MKKDIKSKGENMRLVVFKIKKYQLNPEYNLVLPKVTIPHPDDNDIEINSHQKRIFRTIGGEGRFHQWVECGDESERYPVAIVEDQDGNIHEVLTRDIKFIN